MGLDWDTLVVKLDLVQGEVFVCMEPKREKEGLEGGKV